MGHWYIKRPHAIERFKMRGNFPDETDDIILESELRKALNDAELKQEFLKGCRSGEFAVRISISNREPVYAILKPTPGKGYTHLVPTVLTKAMYETWHKDVNFKEPEDPRFTAFETIPISYPDKDGNVPTGKNGKKNGTVLKPLLFIAYKSGKDLIINEYLADEIEAQVTKLVDEGVPFKSIKVLKEVPLSMNIHVGVTR